MSDEELRILEHASVVSPNDAAARARLEEAWLRRGLGWHGVRLPENETGHSYADPDERGVYGYVMERFRKHASSDMRLVYVPGGEMTCSACHGRGGGTDPRQVELGLRGVFLCADCKGAGRVSVAPFFIGRYPVTEGEWIAFSGVFGRNSTFRHHPVVNVNHVQALEFCEWAGLRLPTAAEWRWAALGAPVLMDWAKHEATPEVRESGLIPRRFPWGNKAPTPETCVAADLRYSRPIVLSGPPAMARGGTAPVVVLGSECQGVGCHNGDGHQKLLPARSAGASWCGAMDMVGNVEQWVACGGVVGFSYASSSNSMWALPRRHDEPMNVGDVFSDVGFRVALDAAS